MTAVGNHPGFQKAIAALESKPWQTARELGALLGYDANKTLGRLTRKGLLRRRVGDRRLQPYEYALVEPTRPAFAVGAVIVRGRADIIERVICSPLEPKHACEACKADTEGLRWHLEALYLGKQHSTVLLTEDIDGARLAAPADHEQAEAYAKRFSDTEGDAA